MHLTHIKGGVHLYPAIIEDVQSLLTRKVKVSMEVYLDMSVDDLLKIVCEECRITVDEFKSPDMDGMNKRLGRKLCAFFAITYLGKKTSELTKIFGRNHSVIYRAAADAANLMSVGDPLLKRYFKTIENRLLNDAH